MDKPVYRYDWKRNEWIRVFYSYNNRLFPVFYNTVTRAPYTIGAVIH